MNCLTCLNCARLLPHPQNNQHCRFLIQACVCCVLSPVSFMCVSEQPSSPGPSLESNFDPANLTTEATFTGLPLPGDSIQSEPEAQRTHALTAGNTFTTRLFFNDSMHTDPQSDLQQAPLARFAQLTGQPCFLPQTESAACTNTG